LVTLIALSHHHAWAAVPVEIPQLAIELGTPFRDNAILQREMKVPVWGWSKPGTQVTVEFAAQKKTATAGQNNKWMIELEPLKASFEPQEMIISESAGAKVILKNILIGEVWLASGQSNMNRPVRKTNCKLLPPPARAEISPIRDCRVTDAPSSLHPIERVNGEWIMDAGDLNAISYAFAHKIYAELDVPIGILHCAVGETAIQAWVPRCGFADGKDEYTKHIYQKILETDPTTPEHKAAWSTFYKDIEDTLQKNKERVERSEEALPVNTKVPGNMVGDRDASWMFNGRMNPMIPYAIRGAIWNQGYHSMGDGIVYYNNLHSMIRGWRTMWNRPNLPVYFHQFYTPGEGSILPSIAPIAEMRLGTWMARDIPHANMASQIDIGGVVHYLNKAIPGQRLALHALKNEYGKQVEVNGPMFKSYTVEGDKLIVQFEHAAGGLVVAETGSNVKADKLEYPTMIENGDEQVKLFYLAGEDRVWHAASMKIDGGRVILTADAVKTPRGVSYATGGVAWQPNLYNRALLPTTPFIYYDHELVTSKTWPGGDPLQIGGVEINQNRYGKKNEYRSLPLLSTHFTSDAVFQADVPVTIWGSAVNLYGPEEKGKAEIRFSFGSIEKTIPVTSEMREWQVILPPMKASTNPMTLKASFWVDGELVHERICENIVYGDVWYVAAPNMTFNIPEVKPSGQIVRMLDNNSKRSSSPRPSRFSVSVSTKPAGNNRFGTSWVKAEGVAAALGNTISAKTGRPVGIIFMQSKARDNPDLKSWIPAEFLNQAPMLIEDYKQLASIRPGNEFYDANVQRYVTDWKKHWSEYIPKMMATGKTPSGVAWTLYPTLSADVSTVASQTYNVSTYSFTPASLKGIIFLSYPELFKDSKGAAFGAEMAALANSWKSRFGTPDQHFFYTIPSGTLAAGVTKPDGIKGKSAGIEINSWDDIVKLIERVASNESAAAQ